MEQENERGFDEGTGVAWKHLLGYRHRELCPCTEPHRDGLGGYNDLLGVIVDPGVLEVREDKPITKLNTEVLRDDGTVVLAGEALCYTMPLKPLE